MVRACQAGILIVAVSLVAALVLIGLQASASSEPHGWDWLSVLESFVNDAVFRRRHQRSFFCGRCPSVCSGTATWPPCSDSRSLARVIDMHQLTKDPERLRSDRTCASVPLDLTAIELSNYLDYCSELLSMSRQDRRVIRRAH